MLLKIRRSLTSRLTAVLTGALLAFSWGPWQASAPSVAAPDWEARRPSTVTVGSSTTTLSWDYAGRLAGITYPNLPTNSFTYNVLGQRTCKTDSQGTSACLYDGTRVLADSRADYTNGGLTGLISERASGTTLTYHGDQIGSTRGLTNGSQTVTASRERDAWGNVVASSGTLAGPFGFVGGQGYQQDADSGLMRLGARYYDPSVGRFISRDPIRYGGGDPNLYRYCGNNPANGTDPSGNLVLVDDVAILAVAAVVLIGAYVLSTNPGLRQGFVDATRPAFDAVGDFFNDVGRGIGDIGDGIGAFFSKKQDIRDFERAISGLDLSRDERRQVRDLITGEGLSLDEIREVAEAIVGQRGNRQPDEDDDE